MSSSGHLALAQMHEHGPAIMYWQDQWLTLPSLLGPMDDGDKWFFMPTGSERRQEDRRRGRAGHDPEGDRHRRAYRSLEF